MCQQTDSFCVALAIRRFWVQIFSMEIVISLSKLTRAHDDIIVFSRRRRKSVWLRILPRWKQNLSRVLKIAHPVTLYLDCGQNRAWETIQLRNSRSRARGLSVRDRTGPIPPPSTSKYFVEQTIIHRFSPPDFQARVERRTNRFVSITAVRMQTSQGELWALHLQLASNFTTSTVAWYPWWSQVLSSRVLFLVHARVCFKFLPVTRSSSSAVKKQWCHHALLKLRMGTQA